MRTDAIVVEDTPMMPDDPLTHHGPAAVPGHHIVIAAGGKPSRLSVEAGMEDRHR